MSFDFLIRETFFFNIKKAHFESINRNLGADITHPLDSFFFFFGEVLKFYLCLVKNGTTLEVSVLFPLYPCIPACDINHPHGSKSKIYSQSSIFYV